MTLVHSHPSDFAECSVMFSQENNNIYNVLTSCVPIPVIIVSRQKQERDLYRSPIVVLRQEQERGPSLNIVTTSII